VEQLLKMQAVGLCSNHPGQLVMYLHVCPPQPGQASYERYVSERDGIVDSLRKRAAILTRGLNGIDGISCNPIQGAMYAFPWIELPAGMTDSEYCLKLLEETGICIVPGSGFGQREGTHHFRTTLLPPEDKISEVVRRIAGFHKSLKTR
jgi:aspartate/methionine/tyrosine aminotransferase